MNINRLMIPLAAVAMTSASAYAKPLKVYVLAGQSNMQVMQPCRCLSAWLRIRIPKR